MKIKRLVSLILVTVILATSLTTNVFALSGCDGTLDTGEIELESYIEWNTFKSKIDGLDSEVLDELRSAESRGILPEIFPVGGNQIVVKTDVGFYVFLRLDDGTYKSAGKPVRFAHWGGGKNSTLYYTGTGTPTAGEIQSSSYDGWTWCCAINDIIDYGYSHGNFYILANVSNDYDYYGNDVKHCGHKLGNITSLYESSQSIMLFVVKNGGTSGIQEALHGYNRNSGGTSNQNPMYQYTYFGEDYFYLLNNSYGYNDWDDWWIQEYSLKDAPTYSLPRDALAVSFNGNTGAVNSIKSGTKISELNNMAGIELSTPTTYPTAEFNYIGYKDREYYGKSDYHANFKVSANYLKHDNGKRILKPTGGIVNPTCVSGLQPTKDYYADPIASSAAISTSQSTEFDSKLSKRLCENGVPFKGSVITNKYSDTGLFKLLSISSSRIKMDYNGKTYHAGNGRLYRRYTPKLGADGKYIVGQTTVNLISGGVSSNATRLTFSNLSLGSDATIKIYGCPIDAKNYTNYGSNTSLVLLETITNAKNSAGTYTTPIYPYGEIKVEFTGGTSTSGRGEGYLISDVEYGRYGNTYYDNEIVPLTKVSCPEISYGGNDVILAQIPTGGKLTSRTSGTINSTTCPSRAYHKILSNVYIPNGQVISITNISYPTNSSYDAYDANVSLQLHPVGSSTVTATLSVASSTPKQVTSTAASGYYDVYAYNYYYSNTRYTYTVGWGEDTWDTVSSSSNYSGTFDLIDWADVDSKFTKYSYTFNYSNLSPLPTGTTFDKYGNFNKTISLQTGDTVIVKVKAAYNYTSNNAYLKFSKDGVTEDINVLNNGAQLANPSYITEGSKYINETMYIYSGNNATYKVYLYDGYYSNSTYKFKSGDSIEVKVYRAKSALNKTYSGTSLTSISDNQTRYLISNSTSSTYPTTSGADTYGMLYEVSITPGSYTYSNHYVYLGNSRYYLNTDVTNARVFNTTTSEPYYYGYNYYNSYLTGTSMTVKAYDTAYRYIYYRNWTSLRYQTVFEKTITPTTKSGYSPSISTVTLKLPQTSQNIYYKIYLNGNLYKDQFYAYGTYNTTQNIQIPYNGTSSATLRVDAMQYGTGNTYRYSYRGLSITANATHYYYDTAGTRINRYTVSGTKDWDYTIYNDRGHFSRLQISNVNIPDGVTVTVDGTNITGNKDFGWLNKSRYAVKVRIVGDGIHGNILTPYVDKLFTYTLSCKDIADATSYYTSKPSANLGTISTTWNAVYGSSGSLTGYTASYTNPSASITGTSNSYVRIISSLSSGDIDDNSSNSSNYTSVTVTATGLGADGTTTITAMPFWNRYSRSTYPTTITDWDWLPATSSTVTVNTTHVAKCFSPNNSYYKCEPSGTAVAGYYIVKASNIPDSTIKTYNNGYCTSISESSNIIGKATLDALGEYDKLTIYAGVNLTASNGYASNNSYYTSCTFGSAQFEDASGNNLLSLTNGSKTYTVPANADRIVFNPTPSYYQKNSGYSGTCSTTVSYGDVGSLQYAGSYNKYAAVAAMHIAEACKYTTTYPGNKEIARDTNYVTCLENNLDEFDGAFTFKVTDLSGNKTFDDGRFGVPRIVYVTSSGTTDGSRLQRVDVYRKYADGKLANLAAIPVNGTTTWFRNYDWTSNNQDDAPCEIYHIGNDLMYVGASDLNANTNGTDGRSMAWLRTGHWHLKGSADDIEGIASSGIQNPVKSISTDDADTEIVVNELDMNAETWSMGHNIKDGRVTDQKLSDDVIKELREINLGTATVIKGDGDQYKVLPINTSGIDILSLDGVTLKNGTKSVDLYVWDDNQIAVEVLTNLIGNKNTGGSTTGSLTIDDHLFKGNVTIDGVSIPVILQISVTERPKTSGKTTITLTD